MMVVMMVDSMVALKAVKMVGLMDSTKAGRMVVTTVDLKVV